MTVMKIVTWNLNHRAGRIGSTPEKMKIIAEALTILDADIIVLTEYVPNKKYHDLFENSLKRIGYTDVLISKYYSKINDVQNQILIASRLPLKEGSIFPPDHPVDGVRNNIFHVTMGSLGIIGLRMPLFSGNQKKDQIPVISHPWWEWVIQTARENLNCPFIFIGDFNCDLVRKTKDNGLRLEQLTREGWTHAIPKDSSVKSFYSKPESKGSTIDHAFLSPQLVLKKTDFILQKGSYHFAKHEDALSDHAVLMVEFDLPKGESTS